MITTHEKFLSQKDMPSSLLKHRRCDAYESAIARIENIIDTADMYNIKCSNETVQLKTMIKKATKFSQYQYDGSARSGRFLNLKAEEMDSFIKESAILLESIMDSILRHELDIISRDLMSTIKYNRKIVLSEIAEKAKKSRKKVGV